MAKEPFELRGFARGGSRGRGQGHRHAPQELTQSDKSQVRPSDRVYSAPMWAPFSATERFISRTSRTRAAATTAPSQKTSK